MSEHRRRVSVLAAGAVSLALLTSPLTTLAQDEAMASVSEACQAANIDDMLKTSGRLTVSTDNPAFFPWWSGDVPDGSEWASFGGYPPSGEGFESGMAYAIAHALGFEDEQVDWVGQAEFGLAFAPGPKDFDFHIGQVTVTEERAQAVDFSDAYYEATQAIVALSGNPITEVATLEELKEFRLGAPGNTTSFRVIEDVIQPSVEPRAPADIATGTQQLANGQIDGLVVDTPSAFYIRDGILPWEPYELEGAVIGEIASPSGETFGLVLDLDSPLTACVNEAIAAVRESGEQQALLDEWINEANNAPPLQ